MELNEAITILHSNGYEMIDEGFLGDKYKKYKNTVLNKLEKFGVDLEKCGKTVEDWIRDYFVDRFDEIDCARAIRDNFKRELEFNK